MHRCTRATAALCLSAGLAACGSGEYAPPIQGQIQLSPQVLPEEGGTTLVRWSAADPSVTLGNDRGLHTSEPTLQSTWGAESAGQTVQWHLQHPSRNVTGQNTLHIRPLWRTPPPLTWAADDPTQTITIEDNGHITLMGTTRHALTGPHHGGQDHWRLRYHPHGALHSQTQWGTASDDTLHSTLQLQGQTWAITHSAPPASPEWQAHAVSDNSTHPIGCAQDLTQILHAQALPGQTREWLLLGTTTAATGPQTVLRHCAGWQTQVTEHRWPRQGPIASGFIVQGSTLSTIVLALNSADDAGAGAAGYITATLLHLSLQPTPQTLQATRIHTPTPSWLNGGQINTPHQRIDLWGNRTSRTPSPQGNRLMHGWVLQSPLPSANTPLRISHTWQSDAQQLSDTPWVWAQAALLNPETPAGTLHLLTAAHLPRQDLPPAWAEKGQNTLYWLQVQTGHISLAHELPWLMHGLTGPTHITAMAQDLSGDWVLVSQSTANGQAQLQVDKLRSDGRGRDRADTARLQQNESAND